ncbi:MAG: hypothetical protein ACYTGN_18900 [Planctomycetota bacterium]|jgi:hypothetical protein
MMHDTIQPMPRPALAGDPNDPVSYLKEFLRGEISFNPKTLSEAYMNLAEQSDGNAQLAYSALAWAVGAQNPARVGKLTRTIAALEERIRALEQRR